MPRVQSTWKQPPGHRHVRVFLIKRMAASSESHLYIDCTLKGASWLFQPHLARWVLRISGFGSPVTLCSENCFTGTFMERSSHVLYPFNKFSILIRQALAKGYVDYVFVCHLSVLIYLWICFLCPIVKSQSSQSSFYTSIQSKRAICHKANGIESSLC